MADSGRQSFTDKAESSLKPESQKGATEKLSDTASDAYEKVAGAAQPESEKSTSQKLGDSVSGDSTTSKDAENTGKSYMESAQEGVANLAGSVQDALGGKK